MSLVRNFSPLLTVICYFCFLVQELQHVPRQENELFYDAMGFSILFFALMISLSKKVIVKTVASSIFFLLVIKSIYSLSLIDMHSGSSQIVWSFVFLIFGCASIYSIFKNEGLTLADNTLVKVNIIAWSVAMSTASFYVLAFVVWNINIFTVTMCSAIFVGPIILRHVVHGKEWASVVQFVSCIILLVPFLWYVYSGSSILKTAVVFQIVFLLSSAVISLCSSIRLRVLRKTKACP